MFDKNNDGFIDLVELRKVRAIEFITILRLSVAQKKSDGILATLNADKNDDYLQKLEGEKSFNHWILSPFEHFGKTCDCRDE